MWMKFIATCSCLGIMIPRGNVVSIDKVRILFVDDEPNVLAGIRRMLRRAGTDWEIHAAESVDLAIGMVGELGIDLIVSDFNMPERDGLDLIRSLKETNEHKDIPVIMLTGNAEVDLKRRALDAGAIDLLSKPVVKEDLLARLHSVLQIRKYQQELVDSNELLEKRVEERTAELERSRNELLWRLAYAVEARDDDTGAHIARVSKYTRVIAESLGLSADYVNSLYLASPLHDIGKIAVPDSILHKPGKLTETEWVEIQKHCQVGWEILMRPAEIDGTIESSNPLLERAAEIALSHHEKWDGSGYPSGLVGDAIPLSGRIVAAADVLDALCTKRSYKESIPFEESFAMLQEMSGKHFDPDVIRACEGCREMLEQIASEEQGEVIESDSFRKNAA